MPERSTRSQDPELSLPDVDPDIIKQLEHERLHSSELYEKTFATNEQLALYIRRRAQELADGDLELTESISIVALEVIEAEKRQVLVDGLNKRLFAGKETVTETD